MEVRYPRTLPDLFDRAFRKYADRTALVDGQRSLTVRELDERSAALAAGLTARGVDLEDRVGILLANAVEYPVVDVGVTRAGATRVPLNPQCTASELAFLLDDAGARTVICDAPRVDALATAAGDVASLERVLVVGRDVADGLPDRGLEWLRYEDVLDGPTDAPTPPTPAPDDVAGQFYTGGTTGDPKGVLHGHRFLLGQLPCFITTFSAMDVKGEDVYWMPMEWAWVGIFNMVFCPFYYGRPVVAYERREFVPEKAFEIIEKYGVTSFLSVPTALRMMEQHDDVADEHDVSSVRVVPSGGEEVGQSIVDWAAETFDGATIQKAYGQTEANIIIGDCTELTDYREGKMGRAAPGHEVEIVDPETAEVIEEPEEPGEIAVRYENDPVCFKEYWNEPEKTASKRKNGWHLMEDLGTKNEDGYFGFVSRKDDVILSSGYRVGPEEVEESVVSHDAVADCGVIGIPHDTRGQVPKAFVVLNEEEEPSEELKEDLQEYVKQNLAKYEYPREIEFVDELPKNPVGKLRRTDLREREGVAQAF